MVFQVWKNEKFEKYEDASFSPELRFYLLQCSARDPYEQKGYKRIYYEPVADKYFLPFSLKESLTEPQNDTGDIAMCSILLLANLVQPEWGFVACDKTLLNSLVCQEQFSGKSDKNETVEDSMFCFHHLIDKNNTCFGFSESFHHRYKAHKMSFFEGKIKAFQFLFDATGVVFPPVFAHNLPCAWVYRRYVSYYFYQIIPTKEIQTRGLLISFTSKVHPFQGGNLHLCGDGTFISSVLQYDGVSDCSENEDEILSGKHTEAKNFYLFFVFIIIVARTHIQER